MAHDLSSLLVEIGWGQRTIARKLGMNETTIRRWAAGKSRTPKAVEQWLAHLAAAHRRHPAPILEKSELGRVIER